MATFFDGSSNIEPSHPLFSPIAVDLGSPYFGRFGGQFVAETLVPALSELTESIQRVVANPDFQNEWRSILRDYVGRPTPLSPANRLRDSLHDPRVKQLWLKREDLCHTGAHKINNAIGQVLLAKRMRKSRVIAETGAGQHGVATATACAYFGIDCEVFMGELDIARQAPNVARMKMLGAKVHSVTSGSRVLKDAMNEAMRDWVCHLETTFYCIGSAAGPHPYPQMVKAFQSVIGQEVADSIGAPDVALACVGGGSNAIGLFAPFLTDPNVLLVGAEAAGHGISSGKHAATLTAGRLGVLHGFKSLFLSDDEGQIVEAHSISAGLDYPGVGPEHAALAESGRAHYVAVTDAEALAAVERVARTEGILIALESAHAFAALERAIDYAHAKKQAPLTIVICLSGRGDKDLATLIEHFKP